jgi:acyl dehydratase
MENKYTHEFRFSQDDVNGFAEITGDKNPIHLDENYASKTMFKRRIIHGFLAGSIFSKVFGTLFPGEGTIYLKQEMKFLAPMYTDESYNATFEITELNKEKGKATVKTVIADSSGKETITGEAIIMNEKLKL